MKTLALIIATCAIVGCGSKDDGAASQTPSAGSSPSTSSNDNPPPIHIGGSNERGPKTGAPQSGAQSGNQPPQGQGNNDI